VRAFAEALSERSVVFSFAPTLTDSEEIFCNGNARGISVAIKVACLDQGVRAAQWPDELVLTIPRAANTCRVQVIQDGKAIPIASPCDNNFNEVYAYDNFNQLTSFMRSSHTQGWTLDPLGNWTQFTNDGTANTQTRGNNTQNQITSLTGTGQFASWVAPVRTIFWARVCSSNSNDRTTEYTSDGDSNLLTYAAVLPDNVRQTTQYTYGISGTVINSNDLLASVTYPGQSQTESYTYNAQMQVATLTGTGQYASVTAPTYDANGNTTKDETIRTYSYDAWNVGGRDTQRWPGDCRRSNHRHNRERAPELHSPRSGGRAFEWSGRDLSRGGGRSSCALPGTTRSGGKQRRKLPSGSCSRKGKLR
jgi:hypothetical protein